MPQKDFSKYVDAIVRLATELKDEFTNDELTEFTDTSMASAKINVEQSNTGIAIVAFAAAYMGLLALRVPANAASPATPRKEWAVDPADGMYA